MPKPKRAASKIASAPVVLESRVLDSLPDSVAHRRTAGFGFTPFDDDLFALGYPHLALFRPAESDPVAEAERLLSNGYPYRDVVFSRHAAVALLRGRSGGAPVRLLPDGTASLTEQGVEAARDTRPLERDEAQAMFDGFARQGELSIDVFLYVLEAIVGTPTALEIAAAALESVAPPAFFARLQVATRWLDALALMLDRLTPRAAAPHAARLRAWADSAGMAEPLRTDAGIGALWGEPCVARPRIVVRADREALARARTERAKEPWYTLPDPRLVFLGGDEIYRVELALWSKYGPPYPAAVAHRLILERFGRIQSPTTVALVASMAAKSKAKKHALAWLEMHLAYATPHLEALASGATPLAEAARALLSTAS